MYVSISEFEVHATLSSFLYCFFLQNHNLGIAQMRWLTGVRVRSILNIRLSFSLTGGLKVNFCIRAVKKMNSSDLANFSPRLALFTEGQKQKSLCQLTFGVPRVKWYSEGGDMILLQLNVLGFVDSTWKVLSFGRCQRGVCCGGSDARRGGGVGGKTVIGI